MADPEESSPLLNRADDQVEALEPKKIDEQAPLPPPPAQEKASPPADSKAVDHWTADGLPFGACSVVGEPVGRAQWDSSLLSCLGRNDEFCGSDLEVCLLGSFAPCVLYGSNVERLGAGSGSFANGCMPYTGLYMLGYALFGWNCIAPWFSYPTRTAIRRKFNLEGSFESLTKETGCFSNLVQDVATREHLETACDFATHYLCHPCALCQEGRELRRRLPHPGFNAQPVVIMLPPSEQTMGRNA